MAQVKNLSEALTGRHRVGVYLVRLAPDQNFHIGFLLKLENEQPQQIHLLWHHMLARQPFLPNQNYIWSEPSFAPDEFNQTLLIGKIMSILDNAGKIPYGLTYDGNPFDNKGKFIAGPIGSGLSCSTFVSAVCAHLGFVLFDETSWPTDDPLDIAWQSYILTKLEEKSSASPEHIIAARESIGCKRFRPAQVFAAATTEIKPLPLDHATATGIGRGIVKRAFGKTASALC
jgi:hypothetical protein